MPTKKKATKVSESSHSVKPDKIPVGRPSLYKQEYCQLAIDYMKDGYSVTAFAGSIGVADSTVRLWADKDPEFSAALKTAQALAAKKWEEILLNVAMTGDGNASAAIFGVKNRSKEEWKDKIEVEGKQSLAVYINGKAAEL